MRGEAIERLKAEHKRLRARIDGMYIDKLDGKIGDDFFDRIPTIGKVHQLCFAKV